MPACSYCSGPVIGEALRGRPSPGSTPRRYCCYGCLSLGEDEPAKRDHDARTLGDIGWKLGVGVLLAGQSMLLGLGVNLAPPDEPGVLFALQALVLSCTLVVVAVLGGPLIAAVFRARRVTVESLFLLTMLGAFAASLQSFATGEGPIYFETVSILLVVYTFSKMVGARGRVDALARSQAWSRELARCRLADGREIDAADIQPGDLVEVRPGEAVAVDGVIESGEGYLCEAARTGEPFATVRRPGDRVLAGCIAEDAAFRIRATAAGTRRQIDHFLDAVEEARSSPSSLMSQADRLARIFLPILVAVAGGTFAYWTLHASWTVGLFNAMSVLLVACPCALGLATPIVVWSALGRLAGRGLITRQAGFVERLAAVERVVFDKTGTLTEERFALAELAIEDTCDRDTIIRWISAVESRSSHPVARAFADLASEDEKSLVQVLSLRVVPGCGVEAEIDDGTRRALRIGRPDWLAPPSPALLAQLKGAQGQRIGIEAHGQLVAIAVVAERLRGSAAAALADLDNLGIPVEAMTGDPSGKLLPLPCPLQGAMTPEEKQARIRQMERSGERILFVGDGINDAAALAESTAGIALASGTDLAVHASGATLFGGDLRAIPWAFALCRQATRLARLTMLWAAGYNLVGMALAATGVLHPVAAALLMLVSSLCVAAMSARIGSVEVDCHSPALPSSADRKRNLLGVLHAAGLSLQGVLIAALLGLGTWESAIVVAICGAAGILLAFFWRQRSSLPHILDMAIGMLTIGNLGMLAGWWIDAGFAPAHGCCSCGSVLREGWSLSIITASPFMWLGMLLTCNAAMLWLTRTPCPVARRTLPLLLGNVGMIGGMLLGGALVGPNVGAQLAGMTLGMIAGMLPAHLLPGRD